MAPSSRAGVGETPEKRLQALIHTLSLPVRLGVVRRAHAEFGAGILEELLPEVACEDRITIRDDGPREAVERIDAMHVQKSNLSSCVRVGEWKKMRELGQLVNQNKDAVSLT